MQYLSRHYLTDMFHLPLGRSAMSINIDFHSHRTQLIFTALAASVTTVGLFSAYQSYSRRQRRRDLNEDILRSLRAHPEPSESKSKKRKELETALNDDITIVNDVKFRNVVQEYDEELVREQLARNYAFFGDEGMAQIRAGTVVVVGCGGVGSWAAVMLVRSYVLLLALDAPC